MERAQCDGNLFEQFRASSLPRRAGSGSVRQVVAEFGFTLHLRTRGEEAKAIKKDTGFKARRWVVKRTHSWMNRFRRILIRREKRADTYLGMLHFGLGIITWRTTGLLR